jgi:hypothetical protein
MMNHDCNDLRDAYFANSRRRQGCGGQAADAAVLHAWRKHADGCGACARELALLTALDADARQTPTPGIGDDRMAALQQMVAEGPEPMLLRSQVWLRAAAAIVLLGGATFFLTRDRVPQPPINLVEVETPAATVVAPSIEVPPAPAAPPQLIKVADIASSDFDLAAMDDAFNGLRRRIDDVREDDAWMTPRRKTYKPTLRRNDKFRQRMDRFRERLEEELG